MTAPVGADLDLVILEPERIYASSKEWFTNYFARTFARPKSYPWCREWEQHEEARQVIDQLWITWESAAHAEIGDQMAVWMRDFMYPMMERLAEDKGVFHGCDWQEDPPKHQPACIPLV